LRQVLDHTTREKTDFEIENRLLMPDGRVKHVHVIAGAAKTGDLDRVGAFRDVTERMRTEETVLGSVKSAPGRDRTYDQLIERRRRQSMVISERTIT
jgi:hypothetical protein